MKNLKKDFNKLALMLQRELQIMKIELLCFLNNFKDLILLLKERTIKFEPLVEKFKKLSKILDYQMLKPQNLANNFKNIEENSKPQMKNLKLIVLKFQS